MTILSCTAFLYELPLLAPLQLGKQQLFSRSGFIIRISNDDQCLGYGEVAPLPGLHRENIETVLQQFRQIQAELIGSELQNQLQNPLQDLWEFLENWLAGYQLYPSLRHGLEMAVFNLLACIKGKTLAGLLNPAYQKMLPVNGLLTGSAVAIQEQVRRLLAEGYTTIKLKVGRQSLEQDIALVRTVRQTLDRDVTLRLDANRLWDFATAVHFGQAVADCAVEYIEEPLRDPRRSTDFYQLTGIPVALDESLAECYPGTMAIPRGVHAIILKPALLGGFAKAARFIQLARPLHIKTVISSVFESGVGLAGLANYAAALCGSVPIGLDTYRWLSDDLLEQRFAVCRGQVDVDRIYFQARQLRSDLLNKLA